MTAPPNDCCGRESGRKDNVEDPTRHAPSVASPALSGQPNQANDDSQPSDAAGQDAGDEPAVSATDQARHQMVTSPSPTAPSECENPEDGVLETRVPEQIPAHSVHQLVLVHGRDRARAMVPERAASTGRCRR